MKEINVRQLKRMLDDGDVKLIDVREKHEISICSIKESILIPMNEIPHQLQNFERDTCYAVICHSGVRSQAVAGFLINKGFNAINVIGGIHDWALVIDKSMKTY